MNTIQLNNLIEQLEPEELESWEPKDFDDVLQGFGASELETELIWNNSLGYHAGLFHAYPFSTGSSGSMGLVRFCALL